MRWFLLAALLVGCGEQSVAGGVGTGGSSAGSSGQAGADGGGSGGTTGTGGTAATAGAGGVDAGLSCYIPANQVSGTDPMAVINQANGDPRCQNQTIPVQIINGVYYDSSWTLMSYSSSPVLAPGMCSVAFTYTRKISGICGVGGMESLYVTFLVPGI